MANVKTDEIIGGKKAQQGKPAVLSPIQQIIQAQAQADALKDFESEKQKNLAAEILAQYNKISGAGASYEPYRESNYTGTPKGLYSAAQGAQHYQTEADKALSIYSANPTQTNYGRARKAAEMYGGADYAKNALAIANPTPANYGAAVNAGSKVGGAAGMLQNKQKEYYDWDTTVRPSYMTRSDLKEIDEKLADPNISDAEKIKLLESRRILEEEYGYGWMREGADENKYYTSDAALREALDEENRARLAYWAMYNNLTTQGETQGADYAKLNILKAELDNASRRVESLGGTANQSQYSRMTKSFGENYGGAVVNAVDEMTKQAQSQLYRWGDALRGVPKEQRGLMQEKLGGETQDYAEYLNSQTRLGERLLNAGAADQAMLNVGLSQAKQTLIDIGMNVMNVGADAILNLAGSAVGIPNLGKARFALGAYGSAAYEAKQRGASLTQQNIRGLASAAVETFSEGLFDGLAGIRGAGRADDMVDNIIGRIAKSDAARNAYRLVFSSAGEGAEEVFSDIAMGMTDWIMFGDKLFGEGWNLEEMAYDYFVGAAVGFFGSGVDMATGGYKRRNVTSEFFSNAKDAGLSFQEAQTAWKAATGVQEKAAKQWLKGRNDELARITWETGTEAGADAKTIAFAAKLSQGIGREVRFFNEAAGAVAVKNGYEKDGVIYINSQSVNPLAQVFSHELTHTLEGTAAYDVLWNTVKKELSDMGRDYELVSRAGIKKLYEDAGVQLTDTELDREVMAQFAEKYLFTDEAKIMQFVKENRNGATRVWTWIKNTLRHVTGRSEKTFLEKAEKLYAKAFKAAGNVQGTESGNVQASISTIIGDSGKNYGIGVKLDSTLLENLTEDERKQMVKERVAELGGQRITAYGPNGSEVIIKIADNKEKFKNKNGKKTPVNKDLATKHNGTTIKQETVVLADELVKTANYQNSALPKYPHGWLDNNGNNMWEQWTTYVQDKNNTVWEATLHIANSQNGEKYLYDIEPIKKVEGSGKSDTNTTTTTVPQSAPYVKEEFSLSPVTDKTETYRALADRLKKSAASDIKVTELTQKIKDLAEYATGAMYDLRVVRERAAEIAREIVNESFETTDEADTVKRIKSFLRDTAIAYPQKTTPTGYDSFEEFRRKNMGRLKFAENGRSVDSVYMELNEMYGEAYFPSDIINHDEMLLQISDMLDNIGDGKISIRETMSAQDIDGITDDIIEQILQSDALNVQPTEAKKIHLSPRARAKAASWYRQEADMIARGIHKAFNLPEAMQPNFSTAVQMLMNEYIRTGKLTDETMRDVFNEAYMISKERENGTLEALNAVLEFANEKRPKNGTDDYESMRRMLSELYPNRKAETPEDLTKLLKLAAKDARKLNKAYEDDMVWSRYSFDMMIDKFIPALKKLRDYVASKQTVNEALSEKDSKAVDDILAGKTSLKRLDPKEYNIDAIRAELAKYEDVPQEKETQYDEGETERVRVEQERYKKYREMVASGEVKTKMDGLKGKAKVSFDQISRELAKKMKYAMPSLWAVDNVNELAGRAVTEMLFSGGISRETIDALYKEASETGRKASAEYAEKYQKAAEYLSGITLKTPTDEGGKPVDTKRFSDLTFAEEGMSIAEAYKEIAKLAPFEDKGTDGDMLWQMNNVAWRVKQAQGALKQAEETDPEFEQWRKNDFAHALESQMAEIRRLKRYMDYRTKAETGEYVMPENPTELYRKQRETSRALTKAKAKELLTDEDETAIEDIIAGRRTLEELDTAGYNVKGIKNVLPMAQEANDAAVAVRQYGAALRAGLDERAKQFTKNAQGWKERSIKPPIIGEVKAPWLDFINTMERNFIAAAGEEEGQAIINEYFKPVHDNEAAKNKELNSYIARVEKLNISQKVADGNSVSEAYAVQFLSEAQTAIDQFKRDKRKTDENGEPIKKGGMTEDEWQYAVKQLKDGNPKLDYKKIDNCIKTMREMYEELFIKVNLARVNNGYEPMGYIEGYFPHFQTTEEEITGFFPKIAAWITKKNKTAVNNIENVTNLPTEIAGTTESRKPGIKWFGNAQTRTGYSTAYDAVEGFDRYVVGAMDVIHHTRDIQKLRALERELRFRTSDKGIKIRAQEIRDDTRNSDDEREAALEALYKEGKYELTSLTLALSEYTNLLAGKKSMFDRIFEKVAGRQVYDKFRNFNSRTAANMVAINPGSWLTNFIPIAQLSGFVDNKYILEAFWDIAMSSKDGYTSREDMQDMSTFLTNRSGADRLTKTFMNKESETLSKPMEWIDMFTAEVVVRARVNQNLADGMSEENAIAEADQFAAKLMADRSKGSMPVIFEATNPFVKAFTQFQLEVNNQLAHFGDMKRESKSTGELVGRIIKYFLATWMYDELYEAIVGRRPGMDPINTINDVVGDLTGKKLPNVLRIRKEGFDAEKKDLYNTTLDIWEDIGENTPFVGGAIFDGGRIPIKSAIPDLDSLFKAIGKGDISGRKRLDYLWKGISPIVFYQALPFGGGQIKKVSEATLAMIRGGKFSVNNEGEMSLQYPVINDGSIFGNVMRWVQASLFGPTSTNYGREWIESGFKSFSVNSTKAYQAATEAGADQEATYKFLQALNKIEKTEDESKAFRQRGLILDSDVPDEAKYYAYYYLLASDKEQELMDSLDGADMGVLTETLSRMKDAEKEIGKRNVLRNSGLTGEQKLTVYTEMLASDKETELISSLPDADDGELVNTLMGMRDAEKEAEKRKVIKASELDGAEKLKLYEYTLPAGTDGEENREVTLIRELAGADPDKVLNTLVELKDYTKNKDKLGVIMKSGLTDKEKLAVYRNRISDERDDDIKTFKNAGMDIDEFMKVQQKYSEISDDKNSSASQKELKFISWLYSGKYNEKQREAIKGTFKYYNMNPANADKYEEMRSAKISDANAIKVVKAVTDLKQLTGETSVKDWQKWEAICKLDLSSKDKETVMRTYMTDAQIKKFNLATKYRVSADEYAGVMKTIYEKEKAKGGGKEAKSLSQEELEAVLDSYGGNSLLSGRLIFGTGALTSMQKAALWQIYNTGWKTANNPYDKETAKAVYDALNSKSTTTGSLSGISNAELRKLLGLD